jgi:hypothetical protein
LNILKQSVLLEEIFKAAAEQNQPPQKLAIENWEAA